MCKEGPQSCTRSKSRRSVSPHAIGLDWHRPRYLCGQGNCVRRNRTSALRMRTRYQPRAHNEILVSTTQKQRALKKHNTVIQYVQHETSKWRQRWRHSEAISYSEHNSTRVNKTARINSKLLIWNTGAMPIECSASALNGPHDTLWACQINLPGPWTMLLWGPEPKYYYCTSSRRTTVLLRRLLPALSCKLEEIPTTFRAHCDLLINTTAASWVSSNVTK